MTSTLNNQIGDSLQVARTIRSASIGLNRGQVGYYNIDTARPVAKPEGNELVDQAIIDHHYPKALWNPVAGYALVTETSLMSAIQQWRNWGFTTVVVWHDEETLIEWRPW